MAALKEVEKEREVVLLQQKQLREQQQNMNEQIAQWLQTRNQSNSMWRLAYLLDGSFIIRITIQRLLTGILPAVG